MWERKANVEKVTMAGDHSASLDADTVGTDVGVGGRDEVVHLAHRHQRGWVQVAKVRFRRMGNR